jgi:hypothetical protein
MDKLELLGLFSLENCCCGGMKSIDSRLYPTSISPLIGTSERLVLEIYIFLLLYYFDLNQLLCSPSILGYRKEMDQARKSVERVAIEKLLKRGYKRGARRKEWWLWISRDGPEETLAALDADALILKK